MLHVECAKFDGVSLAGGVRPVFVGRGVVQPAESCREVHTKHFRIRNVAEVSIYLVIYSKCLLVSPRNALHAKSPECVVLYTAQCPYFAVLYTNIHCAMSL